MPFVSHVFHCERQFSRALIFCTNSCGPIGGFERYRMAPYTLMDALSFVGFCRSRSMCADAEINEHPCRAVHETPLRLHVCRGPIASCSWSFSRINFLMAALPASGELLVTCVLR